MWQRRGMQERDVHHVHAVPARALQGGGEHGRMSVVSCRQVPGDIGGVGPRPVQKVPTQVIDEGDARSDQQTGM